jgi:hypothetical protein
VLIAQISNARNAALQSLNNDSEDDCPASQFRSPTDCHQS